MTTTTVRRPEPTPVAAPRAIPSLVHRLAGALLALGVVYIHVTDQGGIPGDKAPGYVGVGYWLLELTGLVLAGALLAGRRTREVWLLVSGVAAGPLVGFALSRGPGLPSYTDDKGNWTEPLGLVSIGVELALLALCAYTLTQQQRRRPRA